jgi:hypothetical protein
MNRFGNTIRYKIIHTISVGSFLAMAAYATLLSNSFDGQIHVVIFLLLFLLVIILRVWRIRTEWVEVDKNIVQIITKNEEPIRLPIPKIKSLPSAFATKRQLVLIDNNSVPLPVMSNLEYFRFRSCVRSIQEAEQVGDGDAEEAV